MNQWECELRLRFGRRKRKVGFCFEWKAWLIAYDVFDLEPDEFLKKDPEDQMNALAYGAAFWFCVRRRTKVFFTYQQIADALLMASKAENLKLATAMKYAQFPEWFTPDKKKVMAKP